MKVGFVIVILLIGFKMSMVTTIVDIAMTKHYSNLNFGADLNRLKAEAGSSFIGSD